MNTNRFRFVYLAMTMVGLSALLILAGCSKKTTSTTTSNPTLYTSTTTTTTTNTSTFTTPKYSINSNSKTGIGTYLVDGEGLTLYWTTRDAVGQSNITGATLANWPIFYTSNVNVPSPLSTSDFSSITRADGNEQTTFKGWPLYYYVNDKVSGDTLGQGLAGVWYAVDPTLNVPPSPAITTATNSTTTSNPTSTSTSTTTTSSPFPYQGSGSGNWSGQIIYNYKTYNVSGTMTVAVDANGVFSGSIVSSSGGTADTTITAQVDKNGNLTGTVSFTVSGITFITNWQGKIIASGNSLSMQGTWTSQYGSGIFSGTGTSSK